MTTFEWGKLHSTENYKVVQEGGKVHGWVVKIDGKWIARTPDGNVRADFDTMEEAQDFLILILTARGANE